MNRARGSFVGAAALAIAGLLCAACSSGPTSQSFTATPTTARGVTLSTEQTPAGRVLATPSGFTLYDFTPDTPTSSACTTKLCVRLWPPLIVTGPTKVVPDLDPGLVSTIRRANGQMQVTYGGHPLYTYLGDRRPGMVTGQAILNVGGYWYVIAPTGRQITTPFRITRTRVGTPESTLAP